MNRPNFLLALVTILSIATGCTPPQGSPGTALPGQGPRQTSDDVRKVVIPIKTPVAGTLIIQQVEDEKDELPHSYQWSFLPAPTTQTTTTALAEIVIGTDITEFREVWQVLESPDGRFLAVVSAGEGHPSLEVLDLPALIRNKKPIQLLLIDSYPGDVSIGKWQDGRLLISSDMLLTRRSKDGRASVEFMEAQTFSWNPADGKIEAVSEAARDPETYFTKQLSSPFLDARDSAVNWVRLLKAKQALPVLKKMLPTASPDQKKDIQAAIDAIEGR